MTQPVIEANTRLDLPASRYVAKRVTARVKECYRNAYAALTSLPEFEDCTYVEGVARPLDLGIPFEHGWLERPDGSVIDPTWAEMHAEAGVEYYAGDRFTYAYAIKHLTGTLPLHTLRGTRAIHTAFFWALRAAMGGDAILPEAEADLRRLYRMDDEEA